jgi:hypothetical protein
METKLEYIVATAVYFNDKIKRKNQPKNIQIGIVYSAPTHCQCYFKFEEQFNNNSFIGKSGFITSENRFVFPEEALIIANQSNQLKEKTSCSFLTTDDLKVENLNDRQ